MVEHNLTDFASYLERSLLTIEQEVPVLFGLLQQRMGQHLVLITVSDERAVEVSLHRGKPWVRAGGPDTSTVTVTVPRAALDALLRGDDTIEAAIGNERLRIQGPLDTVLTLLESLSLWIHGALRCPSLPSLHAQYLVHGDSSAKVARPSPLHV